MTPLSLPMWETALLKDSNDGVSSELGVNLHSQVEKSKKPNAWLHATTLPVVQFGFESSSGSSSSSVIEESGFGEPPGFESSSGSFSSSVIEESGFGEPSGAVADGQIQPPSLNSAVEPS